MKPRKALSLVLCMVAFAAHAASVSIDTIKFAAGSWARSNAALGVRHGRAVSAVEPYEVGGTNGFYAVSLEGGGTVFMSADDDITPVIAFTSASNPDLSEKSLLRYLLEKDIAFRRGVLAADAAADPLALSKIAEYSFEKDGCGGIAWSGRAGLFYVLRDHAGDSKSKVYPVSLAIDPATGAIVEQSLGAEFTPGSLGDAEGLARDPQTGALWVSDEAGPTIAEYGLDGVATGRTAPVPAIQRDYHRGNLSLEALAISPDGLTMWTANEQALTCDAIPRAATRA